MTAFTVAIMQPYFMPYAGYFRLFAASDLFVIYDCVQFPRRGWVHRNVLVDRAGGERWLTLPLQKAPQNVLIRDLRFSADARERLAERLRPFLLTACCPEAIAPVLAALLDLKGTPLEYIEQLLELSAAYCGLQWRVIRSSTLGVPEHIRGQERILEIARRVGATRYVNPPGGRALYDHGLFSRSGVELRFLSDYPHSRLSILTRMQRDDGQALRADIIGSATIAA